MNFNRYITVFGMFWLIKGKSTTMTQQYGTRLEIFLSSMPCTAMVHFMLD